MAQVAWWCWVMLGATVGTLAGCGEGVANPGKPVEVVVPPPPPPPPDAAPSPCPRVGQSCTCTNGATGAVACADAGESCACGPCADLLMPEAPVVEPCGGSPLGTWRLMQVEVGRQQLPLSALGGPSGVCDSVLARSPGVPRVLMSLQEGGVAQYSAAMLLMTREWKETCATSQAPDLECGTVGLSNCHLGCDACRCDAPLPANEESDGAWEQTESALVIAPWGQAMTFDYCVDGERLTVSTDGLHLVFTRFDSTPVPTPCGERTDEDCIKGGGCHRGECSGAGVDCASLRDPERCWNRLGCSWNSECLGTARATCELSAFGVTPGCPLPPVPTEGCTGVPAACDTLDAARCGQTSGCRPVTGRCAGPNLDCSSYLTYLCPSPQCIKGETCLGRTSCSAFDSEYACDHVNLDYPGDPCSWERVTCDGTPLPCSRYSREQCPSAPGCWWNDGF